MLSIRQLFTIKFEQLNTPIGKACWAKHVIDERAWSQEPSPARDDTSQQITSFTRPNLSLDAQFLNYS